MTNRPSGLGHVKFQHAVFRGPMIALANIAQTDGTALSVLAIRTDGCWVRFRRDGESNRVPGSLLWQPTALCRIAKVAGVMKHVLRGNFTFMFRRGAVSAPSATQRQPRGMHPRTAF